jgi:hypothetical protein
MCQYFFLRQLSRVIDPARMSNSLGEHGVSYVSIFVEERRGVAYALIYFDTYATIFSSGSDGAQNTD